MRIIRTLFVLLLCAMLPLSGLAASGLTGRCPMQTEMADGDSSMQVNMSGCKSMAPPDGDHSTSKGFLCKVTAQCQMGSHYHPVSTPMVVRPPGPVFPVSFQYAESLSIRAPDGFWRPPQAN